MDIKSIWQKLDQISESAASKTTDMKNKKCTACKKGTYQETSQHDDMDGVLHCDKCNKEVKRHKPADSKKKNVKEAVSVSSNQSHANTFKPGDTALLNGREQVKIVKVEGNGSIWWVSARYPNDKPQHAPYASSFEHINSATGKPSEYATSSKSSYNSFNESDSLNEFAPSPGYPGYAAPPNYSGGSGGNFGGSGSGGGGGGDDDDDDDEREFRVIITLYDDSAHDDETAERKVGINVFATNDEKACTKARIMLMNSDRFDGSRITNMTAKPVERPDYSDDLDDDDLFEQGVAEGAAPYNYKVGQQADYVPLNGKYPPFRVKITAIDNEYIEFSSVNGQPIPGTRETEWSADPGWRVLTPVQGVNDRQQGVAEGEMSSRKTDKGETIRKHTAKAGGYGRQIDTDDESGDKFHSTDFDDDKPKRKKKTQGRRGAPEKNADPETGNAKNYDTETLARWIIGNLPTKKRLDKIGKTSVTHKLKEYMQQVESNNLTESIITEGKVKELASVLQDINHGHIDINDLITGKYSPASEIEAFVASKLKEKYDEVAQDNQLSPEDDSEQIYEIILSELHDIMLGNDIDDNYSGEYAGSDVSKDIDLDEEGQVTMEPAQTNTQVIKKDNKVLGQVTNPQLASTIKQAIGNGQMTLAGGAIKEGRISRRKNKIVESTDSKIVMESTLDEVIANYPHEHKMCQEGWGMDEHMFSALCDHYHKDGRIPRAVWHGPMDALRDHVEECYLQDTQPLMGEDELEEDGTFTDIGQVAGTVLGAEGGPVGSAVSREVGGSIGGKIDDALAEDPLDTVDEMNDVLDEEYMEEDGYDALGNPTARQGKEAHDLGYSHAQQGINKNPHAPVGPTYADHAAYNQGQEAHQRSFGEDSYNEFPADSMRSMLDEFDNEYEKAVSEIGISATHTRDFATDDQTPVSRDPIRGFNPYKEYTMESKMNKKTSTLREGNNYDKNITVYGNKQGYFAWDKSSPVVRTPLNDEYEITITSINPHKTGFVDKLKNNIKMKQFKLSQLPSNLQDEIIRILRDFHKAGFQGGLRQYHKNRQDNDLDESRLNELDKSTLGSYVKKAGADATKRQSKVTGHNEFQKGARTMAGAVYGDKVQKFPDRADSKIAKRQAGVGKAVDRLTRDKNVSEATQDDFNKAAVSKSKSQRGRDALANKEKTAARNRATPAAQAAKQKIADYHKKNDEPVKKLEESSEKKKCPPMSHIKKMCKDGKTVAEICKMHPDCDRAELKQMVADCKKSDSKITKAKKSSGKKIAESYDFLEWDKQLTSLISEDITVNITKSSTPGSNSVNVSATGEESEMLMKLIQSAGLGGAELGQSQYRQPADDSAAVTVEPVMHDEVISSLGDDDIDDGLDAMTFLKQMIQHGQSPVEVDVAGDDCDDYEQEVDEGNCGSTQPMSEAEPEDDDEEDDPFTPSGKMNDWDYDVENPLRKNDEEDHDEVCSECDGAGCPECYGDEHVDRAHDHARGMERESVEMDEGFLGFGMPKFKVDMNRPAHAGGLLDITGSERDGKKVMAALQKANPELAAQGRHTGGSGLGGHVYFGIKFPSTALAQQAAAALGGVKEDEMDEGAGVMHFKNQQAKKSGEKSFKLGDKTFPVKEADDDITASGNGDNSEEADEEKSDATRDAGLAASYTPESKSESDIVKSLMEKLNKIGKKSTKCNECGSMMEDDHECSSKKLDEWANSPVGQSKDEQFQTDTDFMTKTISGGLNKIKQDQTTLGQGPLRVKTSGEIQDVNLSMGAMLRKLDGIN